MRPTSVLVTLLCLFLFICGCKKEDRKSFPKGLRGKIIHTSCMTTAVQVLNQDIGVKWTRCTDKQQFDNVIDAVITDYIYAAPVPQEFTFDIVEEKEHIYRCMAADCGPAPSVSYHIVVRQN